MTTLARGPRRLLLGLLVVYVLFLGFVFLFPRGEVPSRSVSVITDFVQSLGGDPSLVTPDRMEVLLNVAIMMPLALLGFLLRPKLGWRDWTALGFVVATAVEVFQGVFLPERSASALDIVANTTGVALGAAVGSVKRSSLRRSQGYETSSGSEDGKRA